MSAKAHRERKFVFRKGDTDKIERNLEVIYQHLVIPLFQFPKEEMTLNEKWLHKGVSPRYNVNQLSKPQAYNLYLLTNLLEKQRECNTA